MYYIIANGNRFKGKKIRAVETVKSIFRGAGINFEVHFTTCKGHARELAEKFTSSEGKHTLVAMGGDGTLHEVVNGFKNFENCSLGLIPNGTGNDFACAAGIPENPELAAKIIAYRAPRPIDFIQFENGLRSINAVGMGIDVDVLKRAYSGADASRGKYLKALITSLIHFKSCNFTAHFNGREEKRYGLIAAIGNGRQIGSGIKLFPEAKIDDGKMDLIIADYISKPKILGAFTKLMSGKVNKIKQVTTEKVTDVTFVMESESYTVQADGELYDNIHFKAHIVAGKLKFFLP